MTQKHIRFDLSKNETHIIENIENYSRIEDYLSLYGPDIPFITLMTALLFVINIVLAYLKNYYVYAGLFFFLLITSFMYRCYSCLPTYILDKLAIVLVIGYGMYMTYKYIDNISISYFLLMLVIFLTISAIYCYGFAKQCFLFDKNKYVSENYMALIHMLGSLVNHMIIAI
jgi:ABC-type multidrug transport system permease subunit